MPGRYSDCTQCLCCRRRLRVLLRYGHLSSIWLTWLEVSDSGTLMQLEQDSRWVEGACAHYVMLSRIQWKPFWLATQLYPPNDWTGWQNGVIYDVFAQASLVNSNMWLVLCAHWTYCLWYNDMVCVQIGLAHCCCITMLCVLIGLLLCAYRKLETLTVRCQLWAMSSWHW